VADTAAPMSGLESLAAREMGLAIILPSLAGALLLFRPVRRLVFVPVRMDAGNVVHAIALACTMLIVLNLTMTLATGLENLASMVEQTASAGVTYVPTGALWAQDVLLALVSLVGVGWLSRRPLRDALRRLGLIPFRWRNLSIGAGLGLLLVPVAIGLELMFAWGGLVADPDVERLSEQLLGPLASSIPGILTLGLAAALGEEPLFRGAMQPRFGLVLTSLLFALLHSTYGLSVATLLVFLLGLALGMVAKRWSTVASMAAHAVYNMTLGVITYVGLLQNV
jgi:hypothetical protein